MQPARWARLPLGTDEHPGVETYRIAGTKLIVPDDKTKVQITMGQKDRYIGSFKLCIDTSGNVSRVNLLKSTGLVDYDAKLQREMWKWRYKPYEVDGKATPVCTAVTFIYQQPPPAP
jgi:hypothetical protein